MATVISAPILTFVGVGSPIAMPLNESDLLSVCAWPLNENCFMPQPRVMYVEQKTDGNRWLGDRGPAEIGEVTFSKTGRTIYFKGRSFLRANCGGGGNYLCVETGDSYWISGVKKRGSNRHWAGGGPVAGRHAAT